MKIIMKSSGRVTIDEREFIGRNISMIGNRVIVDGITQEGELIGDVNIQVFGNAEYIENTSGQVNVSGNSGNIKTVSGAVTVSGDADDISTVSGNVASKICGNVKTISGDINHK